MFPPIDAPNELRPFLLEVQKQLEAKDALLEAQGRHIAQIMEQLGMSAGDVTRTNVQVETNRLDIIELKGRPGLPPGAASGFVVGADVNAEPVWLPKDEWPLVRVYLEAGNLTWDVYSYSGAAWSEFLPPPEMFDFEGVTYVHFLPFDASGVQINVDYEVHLRPVAEGQRFHIGLPMESYGTSSQFSFSLFGDPTGTYNSIVSLGTLHTSPADLYYTGTSIRFMGADEDGKFSVAPEFRGCWSVEVRGAGYTLFPASRHHPDPHLAILDPWYVDNVRTLGADGQIQYADSTQVNGTRWDDPPTGGAAPDASTTEKGIVELADSSEATAGTDAVRAMTPATTAAVITALLSGTPLAEVIRDVIGGTLAEGTGIDITVNDAGDAITISATGGGSTPDATTSTKGILQLAGDFAGTAAAPEVAKIAGATISGTPGTPDGTKALFGDGTWKVPAGGGGATVGAAVYLASSLAAASGSRNVAFDTTERVDSGFTWDGTAKTITVAASGWYALYAHVRLSATVTTAVSVIITANGATCVRGDGSTFNTLNDISASGIAYLTAGDVLAVSFFSTASSTILGEAAPSRTHFRVAKI
ncbi:hypothetical protein [Agromyces sp. NPDC058064]|uniref:BclA C-terminal domain-containing protein n=1 Tax=Agromyces sp. NPDC058064 TaxID=3346322 RepID=UPI0036DEEB1F